MAKEEVPKFEETTPIHEEAPAFEDTTPHPEESQGVGSTLYNKAADIVNNTIDAGKSALKTGVETLADTTRGGIQGLTLGGSDEVLGALKASLPSDEDKGLDWKQRYRKYQALEQEKNKAAKERSPWGYGAGDIAGMITPALITAGASIPEQAAALGAKEAAAKLTAGGLAKLAGKTALVGAGTGAVGGFLNSDTGHIVGATPEEEENLGADVIGGTATGAVMGGLLAPAAKVAGTAFNGVKNAVGNTVDEMAERPFFRKKAILRDLGRQGINVAKEKEAPGAIDALRPGQEGPRVKPSLIENDTNSAKDLTERIYSAKEQLGQALGKTLDQAEADGIQVDASKAVKDNLNKFKNLLENNEALRTNPKAQKLYDTLFPYDNFDTSSLSPREAQSIRDDVADYAKSIQDHHPDIAALGFDLQAGLRKSLGEAVPAYDVAANRYHEFSKLVPETLISGATPQDISGVTLRNMKNDYNKAFNSAKSIITGAGIEGAGTNDAKQAFKNLLTGVNQFEQNEAQRVAEGKISREDIPKLFSTNDPGQSQAEAVRQFIQTNSDQSAALRALGVRPGEEGPIRAVTHSLLGAFSPSNIANKYGLYENRVGNSTVGKVLKAPAELTKSLYNASEDQLHDIGQKMSNVPGIASVGKSLVRGLENKDSMAINAAIFSIMQNPQARILINAEDLKNKKGQE